MIRDLNIEENGRSLEEAFAEVVRGSFWLVLGNLIVSLGGLVFWLFSGRVAGAEAIGYATGAFSLAMMLSSLGNLGLNYAVLREVPEKGARAYTSALTLALILGAVIASLSILFTGMYGGIASYIPLIYLLTISILITLVSTHTLIAALRAKHVFTVNTISTTVKILVGLSLALIGMGGYGLLLGILSAQIVALAASTILALAAVGFARPRMEDLVDTLKIGASNYPQILSNQLVVSAGVVLIALLTGSPRDTGVFYVALMIALGIAVIPGSMASISLPVMVKNKNYGIADESLRIGAAIVLPLAVAIGLDSREVLGIINPDFTVGALTLTILTLAIIPQAIVLNGISKLNSEKNLRRVLGVGIVRLATLLILTILLVPNLGILGASIAYLGSAITPIPLFSKILYLKDSVKLIITQVSLLGMIPFTKLIGPHITAIIGVTLSLVILLKMEILRVKDIINLFKTHFNIKK